MIKPFVLTLTFWTLFVLVNTIADAIRFYKSFTFFGNHRLWHILKVIWLFFALATGYCFNDLIAAIPKTSHIVYCSAFLVVWFMLFRWITHEAFMWKWRQKS